MQKEKVGTTVSLREAKEFDTSDNVSYDVTRSEDYNLEVDNNGVLPETCPIFRQTNNNCKDLLVRNNRLSLCADTEQTPTVSSSATNTAHEIIGDIMKKVVKTAPLLKRKRPILKGGWMTLADVIPGFGIDDETFKNMLFRENLLISQLDETDTYPTPVGGLCLDVQSARGGPLRYQKEKTKTDYSYPKFLVHLSSQFDCVGRNAGSRIMAWVDRDLQTLEETRKEFIKTDDGVQRQNLYVNSQDTFYYLRHNKTKDIYYSPSRARNLVCEGADLLLMRYLALKRFIGTFEICTIYINGDLCRNIYSSKGPQSGIVYNEKLDVCKIERLIIERSGIEHKSITLMTLGGRILKHEWFGCNYVLQLNPKTVPIADKPSPNERIPLEKSFDTDLQLLSLFLDAKTANKKKIDGYMQDHPEIKHFIADYVMSVLQLKPENVFEFTAKYFLGFAPQLLPFSEYFESPSPADDEDEDYVDELNFARYL